ncbi:hypothetical protein FHG87_017459 [Trinorchestia longiramus]|nr:hypothetical protein FHG87_017459 [Trinorchestia longiramus]
MLVVVTVCGDQPHGLWKLESCLGTGLQVVPTPPLTCETSNYKTSEHKTSDHTTSDHKTSDHTTSGPFTTIPLHALSPSSISKLQSAQNKATQFITNAEWHDFNTSAQLHRQTKLAPINTFLHEHAKRIWTNIEHMHPQFYYTYTSHSHKKLDKYHTELSQARKQKHSAPLQHPNTHDTPHHRT